MQLIAAKNISHTLSNTSKMPGKSYSLSAARCKVGSKLRNVKGSVCEGCYAMKGAYIWRPTIEAMSKRMDSLTNPLWVDAMVAQIKRQTFFRWHDSGDLQSIEHLAKICAVAEQTPGTKHWLPTREKAIVKAYKGTIPVNLVIRLSAAMVDGAPPKGSANTSTVHTSDPIGHVCPAERTLKDGVVLSETKYSELKRGHGLDLGHCGDCRACWSPKIENVSYHKH